VRLVVSRPAVALLALLLVSITLLQCWRYAPLVRPITGDDQVYYFIAERAAAGIPPHVSLVDHKHQLTALLSAAVMAAGRPFGVDDVIAARALSIAVASLLVLATFALATRLTGDAATGALAALALLGFRSVFFEAAIGFRTQLFMMSFAVLAHLAFARTRLFTAGLLAAAAFLCWQPAALIGFAMFAVLLAERQNRVRAAAQLLAGGLAAVAIYETYFLWHGAVAEQLRQSYLMNTGPEGIRPRALADTLGFLVRPISAARSSQDYLTIAMLAGLTVWALRALLWRNRGVRPLNAGWRAVLLSAVAAVAFTFLDHQSYPDRFFYLPYVAVTAASLTAVTVSFVRRTTLRALVHIAVAIALLSVALKPANRGGPKSTLAAQRAIAREVAELARANGGGLWVVGRPDLLAFNHMDNWTNIGILFPRVRAFVAKNASQEAYRPLRNGRMPDVIVTSRLGIPHDAFPWLRAEYEQLATDPWAQQSFGVYVRRRSAESPVAIGGIGCALPLSQPGAERSAQVQARDALVVQRAALGLLGCRRCICDTDGSGHITTTDALRALAHATGAATPLRCPACSQGP
jgi:hypothetical protein